MSADKPKAETAGADLISLNDGDIQSWSDRLGVTETELQAAVEKVSPVVEDVRRFLKK
jgi:hypothetical protein